VALSDERIAEVTKTIARVPRGVPVAEFYRRVPKLKAHGQEVIFPKAKGHPDDGATVWFDDDDERARASARAERDRRYRKEWKDTLKEFPCLARVGFRPSLTVGRYTLNPTHALYVATEVGSPGKERFVAAFVREETTD